MRAQIALITTAMQVIVLLSWTLPTAFAQSNPNALTPAEARTIAQEAYIDGFPLVDNYRVQLISRKRTAGVMLLR